MGIQLPILLTLVITVSGCNRGPATGVVHGSVTWDGKPLASGVVRFVPKDGAGTTTSGEVKEGVFDAIVMVGSQRVEFSAPKVVGKRKMYDTAESPEVDVVEELLPPKYNVTSELTLDVVPGKQSQEFSLTSKN